jgi:hypothetical protein
VYCDPAVAVVHELDVGAGSREPASAIRSASSTSVVRMCVANCQPTIIRLKTSITKLKNTSPSQQRR